MENKMKLTIEIWNRNPIELIDLAESMLSLGSEYQSYLGGHAPHVDADGAKLYVKEVRTGSVITELVALAPYPFSKAFVVDVAVETVSDKPILYKVLEMHDAIDREDSEVA